MTWFDIAGLIAIGVSIGLLIILVIHLLQGPLFWWSARREWKRQRREYERQRRETPLRRPRLHQPPASRGRGA